MKTVNDGYNLCQTSKIEVLVKVANGGSLCQTSTLKPFAKIVNELNPC